MQIAQPLLSAAVRFSVTLPLTPAQQDSATLTPIHIQRLLRKVRLPRDPSMCHVMDENGFVFQGKGETRKHVLVSGAVVNAIMHAIASHLHFKRLTCDASIACLLAECGLSPKSKESFQNAVKVLRYTLGIMDWNQGGNFSKKPNSYWFKVAAAQQLVTNQRIFSVDGEYAQQLFGEDEERRMKELAADPCFGATHVSSFRETHGVDEKPEHEF